MIYKLSEAISINAITSILDAEDEKMHGDACSSIDHVGFPAEPTVEAVICFVNSEGRILSLINHLKTGGVIFTTSDIYEKYQKRILEKCACVVCPNPRNTFAIAVEALTHNESSYAVTKHVDLARTSHQNISIGLNTVIEECVTIKGNVHIGPNCSIGGIGFGFYIGRDGRKQRFWLK